MKKLSIFLSALAVMGLAACNDDKTPVLNVPDSFTLNTPPTAEQYYELTPDGTIELTCSQPDYGFVATATYSVEISLDKETTYAVTSNNPNSAAFTINEADVAMGMCQLLGIENPDIDLLSDRLHALKGNPTGSYYPLTPADSRMIYQMML